MNACFWHWDVLSLAPSDGAPDGFFGSHNSCHIPYTKGIKSGTKPNKDIHFLTFLFPI